MKLNLLILFAFVSGWIAGEVAGASYNDKLMWSSILALIIAYLNNAHGIVWQWLKKLHRSGSSR